MKNLLVLVPLVTAHRLSDPQALAQAALAFVGMCLAASSIYLLDDLVDLPRDRSHPDKRQRPLAAGAIPATHALAVLALLWLGTIAAAAALPVGYRLVLPAYVALMLAYVLRVHDLRAADALLRGCGYTLRIVAGSAALGIRRRCRFQGGRRGHVGAHRLRLEPASAGSLSRLASGSAHFQWFPEATAFQAVEYSLTCHYLLRSYPLSGAWSGLFGRPETSA